MSAYSDSIRRNITRKDEQVSATVLIRRYWEDGVWLGADVFAGGWRVASLKTDAGARRRAAREAARA